MSNWVLDTDEHKEQQLDSKKNLDFKARIAAERLAEEKELEKRQAEEQLMMALQMKPIEKIVEIKVKKTRKPRKPRAKKSKSKSPTPEPTQPINLNKLPVYHNKVEVNEFNKFKVDYIKRQIHFCKDAKRKAIYVNALTKYDLSNYNNLK